MTCNIVIFVKRHLLMIRSSRRIINGTQLNIIDIIHQIVLYILIYESIRIHLTIFAHIIIPVTSKE